MSEISATTTHAATRVGAIRTRLEALARQTDLLMVVGVLPRDLGRLRVDVDVQVLTTAILDVFNRHGVSVEVTRDLLLVLKGNGQPNRAWHDLESRAIQ